MLHGQDVRFRWALERSSHLVYPILENGTVNLWLQPLDGSGGHQITQFKSDKISSFQFSPDGKTLGLLRSHTDSDAVLLRDEASTSR